VSAARLAEAVAGRSGAGTRIEPAPLSVAGAP